MKQIIFLFLLLALSSNVFSQQNKFEIGIEGSPSLISLSGNEVLKQHNKSSIGFSGGFVFQYSFPKYFSIHTNLSFERKGAASKGNLTDGNGNILAFIPTSSNFDYLTVPILFRTTIGKKIKYFMNAGPYFGYLIKQTDIYEIPDNPKFATNRTNLDRHFDWGLSMGLGIIIPIKEKLSLSIETRDNMGLFNINHVQPFDNFIINTNSLNLLIGFIYQFGNHPTETK